MQIKKILAMGAVIFGALAVACSGINGETGASKKHQGKPSMTDAAAPVAERDPSEMLTVGMQAPDFEAKDQDGATVRLADFRDKKNVVLVFYPGDNTPGCTSQLCTIRDDWSLFREADVVLFGVNPGDAESHKKFIEKNKYPFSLLVDGEKTIISAYGCKGLFTKRTVYGIDKTGRIVFAERGRPASLSIVRAFEK